MFRLLFSLSVLLFDNDFARPCVCFASFQVGCDRSSALIQICAERGFQAFVSDARSLPLRTASFDACISIAVIHHFSTQVRRIHTADIFISAKSIIVPFLKYGPKIGTSRNCSLVSWRHNKTFLECGINRHLCRISGALPQFQLLKFWLVCTNLGFIFYFKFRTNPKPSCSQILLSNVPGTVGMEHTGWKFGDTEIVILLLCSRWEIHSFFSPAN